MSKPQCWQEVPLGTVAFGASALKVQTGLWRSMRPIIDALRTWGQEHQEELAQEAAAKQDAGVEDSAIQD